MSYSFLPPIFALGLFAAPALAEPPVIVGAKLIGLRISVTLAHPDTGWDHYADGWQVIGTDGVELGLRVLHHPHVTEQPFTRSLTLDALPSTGDLVILATDNRGAISAPFVLTRPGE